MINLPKIGDKCQYYWVEDRSYRTGECVAHHFNKAIILDDEDDTYTGCFAANLRPIKSEAEKQRDKQIESIYQALSTQGIDLKYLSRKNAAKALYNAGCRILMSEWISVKEKLPEAGEWCLFIIPTSIDWVCAGCIGYEELDCRDAVIFDQYGTSLGYSADCISKWMPLKSIMVP